MMITKVVVDLSWAAAWRGLVPSQMTTLDQKSTYRHPPRKQHFSDFLNRLSPILFHSASHTVSSQCYSTPCTTHFHISFSCGQHLARSLALTGQIALLRTQAEFPWISTEDAPSCRSDGQGLTLSCAMSWACGPFMNDQWLEQYPQKQCFWLSYCTSSLNANIIHKGFNFLTKASSTQL